VIFNNNVIAYEFHKAIKVKVREFYGFLRSSGVVLNYALNYVFTRM